MSGGQRLARIISPSVALVHLLVAMDLLVRLPIILKADSNPEIPPDVIYDLFADYLPSSVISTGLAIELLGYVAILLAFFAVNRGFLRVRTGPRDLARGRIVILPTFYFLLFLCVAAALMAFQAIGISEIIANISAKRDIGLDGGNIITYIFLKIAFANHIFAMILLAAYIERSNIVYLVLLSIVTLLIFFTGVVFSQRQSIIIYMFEVIIILTYYRQLTKARLFAFASFCLLIIFMTTVLRGGSGDRDNFGEMLALFQRKIVVSRYFFDFTRTGIIAVWHEDSGVNPSLFLGFIPNTIWPEETINNKEFGHIIAEEIFPEKNPGGVTTGVLADTFVSFGLAGTVLFVFCAFALLFKVEQSMFRNDFSIVRIFVVAKIIVLINSSIDSFVYALLLELPLLLVVRATIVRMPR